jgi:hypothetical protein
MVKAKMLTTRQGSIPQAHTAREVTTSSSSSLAALLIGQVRLMLVGQFPLLLSYSQALFCVLE